MRTTFFGSFVAIGIFAAFSTLAGAQAPVQNSNLTEHERDVKNAMEQARPVSNADAVMNHPIDTDALTKKLINGFKPYVRPAVGNRSADPADIKRAEKFDRSAAAYRTGDVGAGLSYGHDLYYGSAGATSPDRPAALEVFQSLAARSPQARFLAGMMLMLGDGVARDDVRGRTLVESAAAAGDAEAKAYVTTHPYERSSLGSFAPMTARTDRVLADWKDLVFHVADPTFEKYADVINAREGRRREEALKIIEHHAKPPTPAYYALAAEMYLVGWHVPADNEMARQMLEKAEAMPAPKKSKDADYDFDHETLPRARMLYAFANYRKDPAAFQKAVAENAGHILSALEGMVPYLQALAACLNHQSEWQRHYLEIADKNYIDAAAIDLAVMELTGDGGPVNNVSALKRLDHAYGPDAAYIKGRLSLEGSHGVTKDIAKGQALLKDAAAQGQPDAKKALEPSFDLKGYIDEYVKK